MIACGFGGSRNDALNPLDEVETEYHGDKYSVALCRRCNGPFLVREAIYGLLGEEATMTDKNVLYPVAPGLNLEGLPDPLARSLAQARRCYSTTLYDACAVMCRRVLEALCETLSADGRSLAQRLAELKDNGHIDARLLSWADGVRLVGNEAAHDVDTAVSAVDARDILEFTEALLMYVVTLDAKFRSFEIRRRERSDALSARTAQQSDAPGNGSRRR